MTLFPAAILCSRCYRVMGTNGKPLDWGENSKSLRVEIEKLEVFSEEEAEAAIAEHEWTGNLVDCICPACVWYQTYLEEQSRRPDFPEEAKRFMGRRD